MMMMMTMMMMMVVVVVVGISMDCQRSINSSGKSKNNRDKRLSAS